MQSSALAFSATPFVKTYCRATTATALNLRSNSVHYNEEKFRSLSEISGFFNVVSASLVSSSGLLSLSSVRKRVIYTARSASVLEVEEEDHPEEESSNGLLKSLELGALFGLWILFNIYFNIYNKQVLKVYNFPVTVSAIQFFLGAVLVILMWTFNICKRPKISASQLSAILPMAIVHTLGTLFTNMSLGQVSVSFTHTIKAMEPFFSVLLSAMFLGEMPTLWIVSSLVPVVGGVVLASATEASFNWSGFWSAMASNLSNQSRNVLSKKIMVQKEESLDNITLFSVITIMSFILLAPVAVFMEGVKFTPSYLQSAGLNMREVYSQSVLAAVCFHTYQQVAYMLLQRVSPVTHSVANCVKRVVVIVAAVVFFQTPVSPINAFGTGIALAGVFLYSKANQMKSKKA